MLPYLFDYGAAAHVVQSLQLLIQVLNKWKFLQSILNLPRLHVELLLLLMIHRRHLRHYPLHDVRILCIHLPKILLLVVVAVVVLLQQILRCLPSASCYLHRMSGLSAGDVDQPIKHLAIILQYFPFSFYIFPRSYLIC